MFSELLMQREDEKNPIRVGAIGTDKQVAFRPKTTYFLKQQGCALTISGVQHIQTISTLTYKVI